MARPDETRTARTDEDVAAGIPQQRQPSEPTTAGGGRGGGYAPDRAVPEAPAGRDRVRWGPVWAGTLVALSVFVVLELFFFAVGVLGPGFGNTGGIVSAVLALISFFVGGLLAGASTSWRGAGDGLLHGVLVWALSMLGILSFTLLGGSSLLGPLAYPQIDIDPVLVLHAARRTAGWAALGLGLSVAAAAFGGMVGSKIWPSRRTPADTDRVAG